MKVKTLLKTLVTGTEYYILTQSGTQLEHDTIDIGGYRGESAQEDALIDHVSVSDDIIFIYAKA